MKFAKAYSSIAHARRKLQHVTPDLSHWTERDGIQMAMHTGDDKYAVIEISNMELDRLIAAREEQRAKLAAYRAAGSDATLCQFGFDMGEPIRPMD